MISAVQKPGVSTVALLRDEDTMDRIVGIELGADYYMRSPVNPRELVARVKQIFRRENALGMGTRAGSTSGSWRSIRIRSRFLRTVSPPLPPRVQAPPHPGP